MAISSISAYLPLLPPLSNTTTISSNPKFSSLSLPSTLFKTHPLKSSHSSRISAVPELLETLETPSSEALELVGLSENPGFATIANGADVDKMAPKQKIRIKLRSYWVPLIEDSCKQIMDAARTSNAKTMGPVPLPTKKRIYCVLKSPHVHKDARFHFEIRTHQRLIDILYPTAQTIDSLMQLDLPAGVDVEVKL
ncbi:hypothetical protein GIB67_013398 [Kingdonia uniflora]|uniref:Small ribosomal subunit protein uS10c n=1 Tax=Kingdonia uniflora TaxID=39325 RepID=A0A7J7LQZ6_9MAGN|nr:hypothetical protein GIB67_013398 [Kingdonia uniflora]